MLFLSPMSSAYGWGGNIHRAICEIVWQDLSFAKKAWLEKRIKNHKYSKFSTGCAWPDWIRKDKAYSHTRSWHYEDYVGEDLSIQPLSPDCSLGCLRWGIHLSRQQLLSAPAESSSEHLYFFAHLIADLHQPLHVGRKEDLGGNKLKLKYKNKKTNLHQLWDGRMFLKDTSALIAAIRRADKTLPPDTHHGSVDDWLGETRALVHNTIYPFFDKNRKVDSDDVAEMRMLGYQQMAKSARRLRASLQKIISEIP